MTRKTIVVNTIVIFLTDANNDGQVSPAEFVVVLIK